MVKKFEPRLGSPAPASFSPCVCLPLSNGVPASTPRAPSSGPVSGCGDRLGTRLGAWNNHERWNDAEGEVGVGRPPAIPCARMLHIPAPGVRPSDPPTELTPPILIAPAERPRSQVMSPLCPAKPPPPLHSSRHRRSFSSRSPARSHRPRLLGPSSFCSASQFKVQVPCCVRTRVSTLRAEVEREPRKWWRSHFSTVVEPPTMPPPTYPKPYDHRAEPTISNTAQMEN
jgi:hypothetical protein